MAKNEATPEKKPSILLLSFIALWILVCILLAFQDIPVEEALTGYSEDGRYMHCVFTGNGYDCFSEEPKPVKLPELVAT